MKPATRCPLTDTCRVHGDARWQRTQPAIHLSRVMNSLVVLHNDARCPAPAATGPRRPCGRALSDVACAHAASASGRNSSIASSSFNVWRHRETKSFGNAADFAVSRALLDGITPAPLAEGHHAPYGWLNVVQRALTPSHCGGGCSE